MMNKDEIARYYADTWSKHIAFLMNKRKGGDGLTLSREDAEDILSATSLYHMENPDKFKLQFVFIKLIQMRVNFHKKQVMETKAKDVYSHELPVHDGYEQDYADELDCLNKEIDNIHNKGHKEIIKKYIKGFALTSHKAKKIISRFKKQLREKYYDDMDNGYGE